MTQDEIIEMAMKSGCPRENAFVNFDILEEFAKLIAAKEREACAKVCDDIGLFHEVSQGSDLCFALSGAIRARGEA